MLTPEVVQRSHAAGYLIWVWPNDDALENQQAYLDFLNQGMDGLNINFPAQGVAAAAGLPPAGLSALRALCHRTRPRGLVR